MVKSTSRAADADRPAPRLRRAYYDCRYGQLHLHNAIPSGGGFDELTSVVCVHGANQTGRVFAPLLPALGAERSVYALDLPGCGESDPAAAGVAFEAAGVQAILDFVESMRIRRFDLVAQGEGVAIARSVAAQRPEAVRRQVELGEGKLGPEDAATLLARLAV